MLLYIDNRMVNTTNIANVERREPGEYLNGERLGEVALVIEFTSVVEDAESGKVEANEWYFYGEQAETMYRLLRNEGRGIVSSPAPWGEEYD